MMHSSLKSRPNHFLTIGLNFLFFTNSRCLAFLDQILEIDTGPSEETRSWPAALPAQMNARVGRVVILGFGVSLGFGVRVRTRIRVGVRTRIGGRIRTGRCWGRGNVASSFVPLHVPHTSDGLDLRHRGSPVVPVLEFTMFKDILTPPVARIHVSNPPAWGKTKW